MCNKICITCSVSKSSDEFNKDRTKRDGLNPRCKICSRAWHHANKERVKTYYSHYYEKTKDYHAEKAVNYRAVNRNSLNEKKRKWDADNKERREKYRLENSGLYRQCARNRRSRINGNSGSHTEDDVYDLIIRQLGRCVYCKCRLTTKYHVDHWMPIALGGSNGPENLQILCAPCNFSKNDTHPIVYERLIGHVSRR